MTAPTAERLHLRAGPDACARRRNLAAFLRGADEELLAAAQDAGLGGWYRGRPRRRNPRTEAPYAAPVEDLLDAGLLHLACQIFRAVRKLDLRHRQLVRKLYGEHKPHRQVAREMGYSERWVRDHQAAALDTLDRLLFTDEGRPTPL